MKKKQKEPAFLFYPKDYYEGTRIFTASERGCYMDLLCYQFEHQYIPDDPSIIRRYTGVSKKIAYAVLHAKFTLSDKGWYNQRLKSEIEKRKSFSKERSESGKIGNFFKVAKSIFDHEKISGKYADFEAYIKKNYSNNELISLLEKHKTNEKLAYALRIAQRTHIENENNILIEDNIPLQQDRSHKDKNESTEKEKKINKKKPVNQDRSQVKKNKQLKEKENQTVENESEKIHEKVLKFIEKFGKLLNINEMNHAPNFKIMTDYAIHQHENGTLQAAEKQLLAYLEFTKITGQQRRNPKRIFGLKWNDFKTLEHDSNIFEEKDWEAEVTRVLEENQSKLKNQSQFPKHITGDQLSEKDSKFFRKQKNQSQKKSNDSHEKTQSN